MVDEAVLEAGGEAVDQVDELPGDVVAARVPVPVRRSRTARTGRRRSAGACPRAPGWGRSRSGCRSRRTRPRARRASQRLEGAPGRRPWCPVSVDRRPRGPVLAGGRGPGRQPLERGVELDDRAADLPALEPVAVGGVDVLAVEHRRASASGRRCRSRSRRGSTCRPRASTPSPGTISATGTPQASTAPASRGGVGDREADHPHPALDVAPERALGRRCRPGSA